MPHAKKTLKAFLQRPELSLRIHERFDSRSTPPRKAELLQTLTESLANQLDAASFMILIIVSSTSCATLCSCGVLNIARRVVGFKVARMVFPPSS
jgi:hypothetical protein